MVCMLMHSRRSVTRFGGIGVMALTAGDGTMAGDGIVLITLGDITPVIGVAATGVAIGATIITTTIIIIRIIPVTVGAAATGEAVMDGMAQADVIREYMPEDTPTAMALHAQAGIIM